MHEDQLVYDTLIVGGGPAGVSAAMHLSFHRRKVVIVDRLTSPMNFHTNPVNNYPGVKPPATGVGILRKMKKEVRANGVEFEIGSVVDIRGVCPEFKVLFESRKAAKAVLRAKTLVLATGSRGNIRSLTATGVGGFLLLARRRSVITVRTVNPH